MIAITLGQFVELFMGLFAIWLGVFQLSKNTKSTFSWLIFLFFFTVGFCILSDPILTNTPSYHVYVIWQKITDWPLFIMPVLCLHLAMFSRASSRRDKPVLIVLYTLFVLFVAADVHGGLVLRENILRYSDYRRIDAFAPGILMIPFVLYCVYCFITAGYYYYTEARNQQDTRFFYPIIGLSILTIAAIITGLSLYIRINSEPIVFNLGIIGGLIAYLFFVLGNRRWMNSEQNIFDKSFLYRTTALTFIILAYLAAFFTNRRDVSFQDLVFLVLMIIAIIFSHTFFDWINTFINDLLYNPSSGLSVVSDQEVYDALRNYNVPDRLENSPLLRLGIAKKRSDKKEIPVDSLRSVLKNAVEYFKPEEGENRRTKYNIKYHLLKMIAFDQSEEGQILWELGFDEYPVAIMTRENKDRKPLFQTHSPSDYFYTSRNAYIALKKEAIHDVAWRISYLEKLAKR